MDSSSTTSWMIRWMGSRTRIAGYIIPEVSLFQKLALYPLKQRLFDIVSGITIVNVYFRNDGVFSILLFAAPPKSSLTNHFLFHS